MFIRPMPPRTSVTSSSKLISKALIFLGENSAYDIAFFSLLAQKRNSEMPLVPFVVFNILMGLLDRIDPSILDSFLYGFDFVKKDSLLILNPIALMNIGGIGWLMRVCAKAPKYEC